MAIGDIVVGIDLGFSGVSMSVGKVDNFNQIQLLSTASEKCNAILENGNFDEDIMLQAIQSVLEQSEEKSGLKIHSTYISISGKNTNIIQTNIDRIIENSDGRITNKDIVDTIIEAGNIKVPDDEIIIDIIPDRFMLDGFDIVTNPIGSKAEKLTLLAQVITSKTEYIKMIQKIFRRLNLEIDGFAPKILTEKNIYLEHSEAKKQVALIDVGAKNTEIGVFLDGVYVYTATLPIGGQDITSDLKYVFNITEQEAEKLKRTYPIAKMKKIPNDNNIQLTTCKDLDETKSIVKISNIVEVMEARIEDIFLNVKKRLETTGLYPYIDLMVLAGQAVMNIEYCDELAKETFKIDSKYASNKILGTIRAEYYGSYSLIRYFASKPFARSVRSNVVFKSENTFFKKIINKITDFFYS